MTDRRVHDLALRDLTKVYNPNSDEQAVKGVSLQIARGEFVALLGPSGSGKTTTLMMVAGFEEPTSGDILVDGRSIVGMPPNKRDIGIVFQNYALFPKMTVAENIAFPLRMRHRAKSEIAATVARLLDLIRMPEYGTRYPNQLSGGQQQRVALARALAFDPKLLLLDEPMGALDRKLREQLQLEVKRIQRELGVTTVYVTHDQEEAMVLADRVAIMNLGRIEQVGPPAEVYNRPVNRFVAQFLGTANLIPARVTAPGRAEVAGHVVPFAQDGAAAQTPGSSAALFVRPECVTLAPADQLPSGRGLPGTVDHAIFVGDSTRYAVRVGADIVQVTAHNRAGLPTFAAGDSVTLLWSPENARVLAPSCEGPWPAEAGKGLCPP